jgi:transposase InsO family protein
MYNGEIISYGISKTPSAISVLSAQKKAIEITSDCPYRRTFHSDRGWAYQMPAYAYELKENKIFQSMSRKGNCYDNSVMENFFGMFKTEALKLYKPQTLAQARALVHDYIQYYNTIRMDLK